MSRRATLPRPSPWLFDVTLTAVLLVCGLVALYVYTDDSSVVYRDGDGLGVLLVVAGTVALVFRRRMAPVVALVTAAAAVLLTVGDYAAPTVIATTLVAAYSAGAYAAFAPSLAALAGMLGAIFGSLVITQSSCPDAVGVGLTAATVQTHVGKLLAKLGVRDRVQAAVYAYASGLVEPGAL
jgi:hypothetical protein